MARPKMGDERREQILSAFERCVIRDGLAKTSLQNVAEESDLPRSLVRYFVGNREDMIGLLIHRMVERAENSLARLRPEGQSMDTAGLMDFLFDDVFNDETSNAVVAELWYLAVRDVGIRSRLASMYAHVRDIIVLQLKQDDLCRSDGDRKNLAHSLVCLGYGDASLDFLGLKSTRKLRPRVLADALLQSLE